MERERTVRETKSGTLARSLRQRRRLAVLAAIGSASLVLVGWGCSSDEEGQGGPRVVVDPGGTFGAEFTLAVIGRGRITGSNPNLECPGPCFAKYTFPNATAPGASGAVTLKASPTPGSRFRGWRFDTDEVGSRGRGADICNPIKRAATVPSVDLTAAEITLPFGEVQGNPPAGQEAACAGSRSVPIVYKVVAEFDSDPPIPDGGADADGGNNEILFLPPGTSTVTAQDVGMAADGYMYWRYGSGTPNGIAYASSSQPQGSLGQTPNILVDALGASSISIFEVDARGLVYQTSSGVFLVRAGAQTSMGAVSSTCNALAVDSNDSVYCRTSSTILRWTVATGYASPTTLFIGQSTGTDLAVDSTGGRLYFSTSSAINTHLLADADGGVVVAPQQVVSGRSSPTNLELDPAATRLWWSESSTLYASSGVSVPSTATLTNASGTSLRLAPDPADPAYFYVSNTSSIYHAYALGGASTQVVRTGIVGLTGVTADTSYIYWSQTDGRIRRMAR